MAFRRSFFERILEGVGMLARIFESFREFSREEFADSRIDELKSKGLVSERCEAPSADTFRRVLEAINSQQLHRCLIAYGQDIIDELAEKQIDIDGKKLRGTSP